MSTGYDDGGSERLICVGPPDGGGDAGPDDFFPSCFINGEDNQWPAQTIDTTSAGVNDFSIEVWVLPFGPAAVSDHAILAGTLDGDGLLSSVDDPAVAAYFNITAPGGFEKTAPPEWVRKGWNYWAINFDRSGLMSLYVNGVLLDTDDISAHVAQVNAPIEFGRGATGRAVTASGPFAWHTTLLTGDQMLDSMRRKGVQQLASTQGSWHWRDVTGHTGWETRPDHIHPGYWNYGTYGDQPVPMPWGVPIGVNGTVTCPDRSGNGRDLYLRTWTEYVDTNVFPAHPCRTYGMTLGADLFFR